MYGRSWSSARNGADDTDFIAACDPQTIISLIQRVQRTERERDEALSAMPHEQADIALACACERARADAAEAREAELRAALEDGPVGFPRWEAVRQAALRSTGSEAAAVLRAAEALEETPCSELKHPEITAVSWMNLVVALNSWRAVR